MLERDILVLLSLLFFTLFLTTFFLVILGEEVVAAATGRRCGLVTAEVGECKGEEAEDDDPSIEILRGAGPTV